ncbi:hypothetical protein KAR91_84465 [Candidatus Pacearchaeota archaeon]|nr:hypothetical protein [Candidatus Pacearchaeota archaeon]
MVYAENNLETNCPINGWVTENDCSDCIDYNDCAIAMRFDDDLIQEGWIFSIFHNGWIQDKEFVEENLIRAI